MLKKWLLVILASATFITCNVVLADLTIGINAPRGKEISQARWSEFGTYLSTKLGEPVSVKPLLPAEFLQKSKNVDLVLANPTQTVILLEKQDAIVLATLNKKSGSQFGGVIVSKKGSGINTSTDLKNKKVMSLKFRAAAGAYMFQTYHLIKKGINPHEDFLSFSEGKTQDELVMAVKNGNIDAAFVRTGTLESMAKEDKINFNDFVIVDEIKNSNLAFARTTDLYPEWSLMATPKIDPKLAKKVKKLSLALNVNSHASKRAKIKGFVPAEDITPMREVMMELGVYPFD